MKAIRTTGLAILAAFAAAAASAATPPAIYTAAQATAGAAIYAQNCAMCHGANLAGEAGNPGGLTHDQYSAVMAYILQQNGYPAGSAALDYNASLASSVPLVSQVK